MLLVRHRAALLRGLPFAVFIALLALRGLLPAEGGGLLDGRWFYLLQAGAAALLLWVWRREFIELTAWPGWRDTLVALVVGCAVFWLWVRLDEPWMRLGTPTADFRPLGPDGELLWTLVALRWLGAVLVVPLMEELFWRSFLMRWLQRADFLAVDPRRVGVVAILLSSAVFALAHTEWLAAVVAGLAYAGLYRWSGKLWTAVIAHLVTNALLGLWVIVFGHWAYW